MNTELFEMFDDKDDDCVDMVLPFVAAMVDRCCGLIDVSMNKLVVEYVEHCKNIFCSGKEPCWSDPDEIDFRSIQCNFFCVAQSIFFETRNLQTCALSHGILLIISSKM